MYNYIYISIPDFLGKFILNKKLIDYYVNNRNYFYDDIVIDSIYGSFPCIWNGGRYIKGEVSNQIIKKFLSPFLYYNIPIRYTFTNNLINQSQLTDELSNKILDMTSQLTSKVNSTLKNSINVSSPILKNYLIKNYSSYNLLTSTTLGITDIDRINQLSKDAMLVLDYRLNNKFDILSKLKYPNNIEILATEICVPNCQYRQQHYDYISRQQLGIEHEDFICKNSAYTQDYYNYCKYSHFLNINDIRKNYLPLGISHFKISGRGEPDINVVEKYVNLLIKDEYRDEIRNQLLLYIYK